MYTHIHTHTLPPLFCPAGAIHRKCRHTPGVSAAYHLHRFGRVQAEGVHFCYTLSMVFRCTLLHFCYTLSMVCRCTLLHFCYTLSGAHFYTSVTPCQVHTFTLLLHPVRSTLLHLTGAHFYTSITPCQWCSGAHFYTSVTPCQWCAGAHFSIMLHPVRCTLLHLTGAHFYTSVTPCQWCSGAHFYTSVTPCQVHTFTLLLHPVTGVQVHTFTETIKCLVLPDTRLRCTSVTYYGSPINRECRARVRQGIVTFCQGIEAF
jgi:tRNA(Arg) A34 adenosine deaminase TadA